MNDFLPWAILLILISLLVGMSIVATMLPYSATLMSGEVITLDCWLVRAEGAGNGAIALSCYHSRVFSPDWVYLVTEVHKVKEK